MFIHLINIAQAAEQAVEENQSFVAVLGIDWKLFLAQIINFGLVVLVLWKWVYKPLLKILNERSRKIEKSLKEAQEIEKRLASTKSEQESLLAETRQEAEILLAKAEKEAVENKNKLVQETEEKINKQLEVARQRLIEDKDKIAKEIKMEVADMIEQSLIKIIPDQLDQKSDKKIIKKVLEKHES
jgi:F-type H+-transporting ATPase subunit b